MVDRHNHNTRRRLPEPVHVLSGDLYDLLAKWGKGRSVRVRRVVCLYD